MEYVLNTYIGTYITIRVKHAVYSAPLVLPQHSSNFLAVFVVRTEEEYDANRHRIP